MMHPGTEETTGLALEESHEMGSGSRDRVLVDSSLWVDFLRPDPPSAVRIALTRALTADRVCTVPIVIAEVAQGAPDEEALVELLETFSALHQLTLDGETGGIAARIGFALRRRGHPVPMTDLLIAATAIREKCELWHRDHHFETISGVAPLATRVF